MIKLLYTGYINKSLPTLTFKLQNILKRFVTGFQGNSKPLGMVENLTSCLEMGRFEA